MALAQHVLGIGDVLELGLVVMALEKTVALSASKISHRLAAADEGVDLLIAQTVDGMLDDVV